MSERQSVTCSNCGSPDVETFCAQCGQAVAGPPDDVRGLVRVVLSGLGVESRALRTALTLLTRPGRLTADYLDGRRVRYASPIQTYLACTALFFIVHAYRPFVSLDPELGAMRSDLSSSSTFFEVSDVTRDRLADSGVSMALFAERFDSIVAAYLPVFLAALAIGSVALLALLFWRESTLRHGVFTLHWFSFYFTLESVRQILPVGWGRLVPVRIGVGAILMGYLMIAMRVAYRRGWITTALRAAVTWLVFAGLLALWMASTMKLAERIA